MNYIDTHMLNPYIRVAQRSILSKGHCICKRVIFDYELIYIESSRMIINYD